MMTPAERRERFRQIVARALARADRERQAELARLRSGQRLTARERQRLTHELVTREVYRRGRRR
jgi:hypothetical protein